MASNSLSPGFIRVNYTSNAHPHICTLPVNVLTVSGSASTLTDKGGATQLWTAAAADIALWMKGLITAADSIDTMEFWSQPTPTSVPVFVDAIGFFAAGTGGGAIVPFSQIHFSFRTLAGGRGAFQMMETDIPADQKFPAPGYAGSAALQAVDTYLTGINSVVWGRDNSYYAVGIRAVSKTNDKLRKKFFNP